MLVVYCHEKNQLAIIVLSISPIDGRLSFSLETPEPTQDFDFDDGAFYHHGGWWKSEESNYDDEGERRGTLVERYDFVLVGTL